jgi:uncharacterized protein (DUF58 family)
MPVELTPDILARISKLELNARQIVDGYLAGRHRSPRQGIAVEFAQHREYAPGDDIKHLDWKVFARTERYHLKQYEQETNLVAWLIVDASESMAVGTVNHGSEAITKYDVASTLAAALSYLVIQQADTAGLVTFAEAIRTTLKPSSQQSQVRDILRTLSEGVTKRPSNAGKVLRDLGGRLGRRSVIFVFSDLLDELDDFVTGLRILRSQKHEVVVFQVLDAAEIDFPFRHPTLFRGLEELPELSTDPLSIREHYLKEFAAHQSAVESACRTMATDLVRIRTDDNLAQVLAAYLQKRMG